MADSEEKEKDYVENETMYGDYLINSVLGESKVSIVFLVEDMSTFEKKVLKRIAIRDDNIEKIEREINIMRALNGCPYTLHLIDAFIQDNYYCIITPYYPNGCMCDIIPYYGGRMIPEDTVRCVIHQVLLALQYMHGLGYCHRDIKPDNILVVNWNEVNPKVLLCDFGFATKLSDGERSEDFCGTLDYAAPEIYLQHPYDNSVDMWSLGVTIHYLLFQQYPLPEYNVDRSQLRLMLYRKKLILYRFNQYHYNEALNLFEQLCSYDPDKRLSIEGALQHPWVNAGNKDPNSDSVINSTLSIISDLDVPENFT